MKVQICSTKSKQAAYYLEQAVKMGYTVYEDELDFICVDVLTDPPYWRSENMKYKSFGNEPLLFTFSKEGYKVEPA